MPVLILSLIIALLACVLLLAVFGLFTISPFARRLEGSKRTAEGCNLGS
ncbi:MAG: hypothetical protein ACXVHQ_35965 [Solirubrobacteraceae bacterium]